MDKTPVDQVMIEYRETVSSLNWYFYITDTNQNSGAQRFLHGACSALRNELLVV